MKTGLVAVLLVGCTASTAHQHPPHPIKAVDEFTSDVPVQDPIPGMAGSIEGLPPPDDRPGPEPPSTSSSNDDRSTDYLESSTPHSPERALGERWSSCIKEFVESQRERSRQPLIDALTLYSSSCDKVERRIVVQAPTPTPSGRQYILGSYVSLEGQLAKGRSKMWLRVVYHGDSWIFANRITVASDEYRWNSPRIKFVHDHDDTVWEIGSIPFDKKLVPIVRKIIDGSDVTIRFYGKEGYVDLDVTSEMKADLRLMADALVGIGIP